ncbi:hypothetical protein [Vibrio parahaemolyticus]|uniref:hypothetical protein n=2 Tax=Vibrio parahaemolyticus TaxID=670 RepID=UPI00112219C8|nr:hypothetical protein [Vibrio parahaemolyticus]HAS6892597.1 hypothetical protein [Vibrio parahaemolyticus]
MRSKKLVVFLMAISLSSKAQVAFYDSYSGMLKKQGNTFILSKCGTASADFTLKFEEEKLVKQLPDLTVNDLVQLRVKAKVEEKDGQYYLVVHEISSSSVGSSCNLLDLFS